MNKNTLAIVCAVTALVALLCWHLIKNNEKLTAENLELTAALARQSERPRVSNATPRSGPGGSEQSNPVAHAVLSSKPPYRDPAYASLWYKQALRGVRRNFGNGIYKLGLSEEKRRKLEDLYVQRSQAVTDAADAASMAGLSSREISLAAKAASKEIDGEIATLITPDQKKELEESQALASIGQTLDSTLGVDFQAEGVPLTDDQRAKLIQIWDDTRHYTNGTSFSTPGSQPDISAGGEAIIASASPFLNPSQLRILTDYEREQFANVQYYRGTH